MKMNTPQTEEYFLKKFMTKSPTAKCKAIIDCFSLYALSQEATTFTKSKRRIERLDDSAEVNFRLACKQLELLSPEELTIYLNYVKSQMTKDFDVAKEDQKLYTRIEYSRLLRHLPDGLTSEQQGLRDEMQRMLDNYYVKDGRQML
jgi:hypothetical protein